MKILTQELTGNQLDYAVAVAEGNTSDKVGHVRGFRPSVMLYQGGALIEKYGIKITHADCSVARIMGTGLDDGVVKAKGIGPTDLIAAMRCVVDHKLGKVVEIPDASDGRDLSTCPRCRGEADNGHDREYPPNVYLCGKCTETQKDISFSKEE